jgi:hypothetical protein
MDTRLRELPRACIVIHGDANGADRMAAAAAARHGHTLRPMPADWEREGNRAGILRNLRMLDERPELVIAWWDGQSRGTAHTITEAKKRGIPVEVHKA